MKSGTLVQRKFINDIGVIINENRDRSRGPRYEVLFDDRGRTYLTSCHYSEIEVVNPGCNTTPVP